MSIPIDKAQASRSVDRQFILGRLVPLGVVLALMAFAVAMGWHRQLSLETLARHRSAIEALVSAHWVVAIFAFIAVYAAAVALSFPGAALLTIGGGMLFGTLAGGLSAVAAATIGATAIFLITKFACGCVAGCGWVRRAGPLGEKLAAGFRKNAFWYLVFLRLVPLFPFWLVNLVPAPAGVGLVPFIAATALGIIPATFAYAFFGAGLNSAIAAQDAVYEACVAAREEGCHFDFNLQAAATPELIGGLVILGLIALIPPAVKRYGAMRCANGQAKAAPTLPSPASRRGVGWGPDAGLP
jgi:uncharacterized membrane protein YdjX (TVP38/TMEM64 family)